MIYIFILFLLFIVYHNFAGDRRRVFSFFLRSSRYSSYSNDFFSVSKVIQKHVRKPRRTPIFARFPSQRQSSLRRVQLRFSVAFSGGESQREREPPIPLQTHASRLSVPSSESRATCPLPLVPIAGARSKAPLSSSLCHPPTHLPRPSGPRATPLHPRGAATPRTRLTAIMLVHAPSVCRQPAYQSCRSAHVTKFLLLLLSLSLLALTLGRWCVHSRFDCIHCAFFIFDTAPLELRPYAFRSSRALVEEIIIAAAARVRARA